MNIDKALQIQATIRAHAGGNGSGLIHVPAENLADKEAIRVLQVQIFQLSDAVAELAKVVDGMARLMSR